MIIKGTILLDAIAVLCTAAVIKTSKEANIIEGCKSDTELWPSEDFRKFFFCIGDNKSIEQTCENDTYFVHNTTVSGCVPRQEISEKCIYKPEPEPCADIHLQEPQTSPNPTKFYLCPAEGMDPVELPCPDGKAFVKENGWTGCVVWKIWRNIRGCNSTEY